MLLKGLPLAYNRDLQEDKAALFEAHDTVAACLNVAAPLIDGMRFRRENIESRLEDGFLDATTLMESFILRGMPMRLAHEAVGKLVRQCEQQKCRLVDLPASAYESIQPGLGRDIYSVLGVKNALAAFRGAGSTAPAEVEKQLEFWRSQLLPKGQ